MRAPVAALAFSLAAGAALAAQPSPIHVSHGWVRASLAGQHTGAAYLTLTNTGRDADRLIGGETPAATALTPHHMAMERGVMVMRKLDGVALPPGGTVVFAPEGDHLMLEGLKRPLKAGELVAATLHFQHAGAVKITLPVRAASPEGTAGLPGIGR